MALDRPLQILVWIVCIAAAAMFMEGWAAFLHGRVWHGVLWRLHRSHHSPRKTKWEANDVLSVTHAPIAIALILYGCVGTPGLLREIAYGWGIGMSLFGMMYLTFHDGLVHGRLPVQGLLKYRWARVLCEAHKIHHKKDGGPYGFFYVPSEYRSEAESKAG